MATTEGFSVVGGRKGCFGFVGEEVGKALKKIEICSTSGQIQDFRFSGF